MADITAESKPKADWRTLPRNVQTVSPISFFMDVSSEMVISILPLFLSNMLGVKTNAMQAVSFHAGVVAAGGWQPVVEGG
jgi:hypothetical protein